MDSSVENSKKLDRVLQLLEGERGAPGLLMRQSEVEEVLFGKKGNNGLANRVNIMWRIHVWLLCSLSAVFGWAAKGYLEIMFKRP